MRKVYGAYWQESMSTLEGGLGSNRAKIGASRYDRYTPDCRHQQFYDRNWRLCSRNWVIPFRAIRSQNLPFGNIQFCSRQVSSSAATSRSTALASA